MGAWGSGNFENDSALDWLAGFNEKKSLARLKAPLEKGLADKNGDDWDEALVAAEIVALMRGHPSRDCPGELLIWAQQNQVQPKIELVTLARKFLVYVIKQAKSAEFQESFDDAKSAAEYLADKKKFLKRLEADDKKLSQVSAISKPRKEPWVFVGYVTISRESGLSVGHDGDRLSLAELPEVVKLKPRPKANISIEFHLDFFFTPKELDQLARFVVRNAHCRVELVRLSGSTYLKNKDLQGFLEKIAPTAEYLDLRIGGCELDALNQAQRISRLRLSFKNKMKGSDLAYLSGMRELEILKLGGLVKFPTGDVFRNNRKLKFLVISAEELEGNRLADLPESVEELGLFINKTDAHTDLSSLTRLPRLQRLEMSVNAYKPIPAAGLESLELGRISSESGDLGFLSAARNLRELELISTAGSLSFLQGKEKLERLSLRGGYQLKLAVDDWGPVEKLPKLTTLHLSSSLQIQFLPRLPRLKRFDIFDMRNVKPGEVAKFPKLEEIHIGRRFGMPESYYLEMKQAVPKAQEVGYGFDWQIMGPWKYGNYFS